VDYQKGAPAINSVFYMPMPANYYVRFWSSTKYAGSAGSAWLVDFNDGYGNWNGVSNNHFVRCVR
jgi:hypothetical protein